jgi:hypothetical protein
MPLRAGNPFYFLLSAADQALVDPTSIEVDDVPYAAAPVAGSPYPQSLRVRFKLNTPQGSAPQLRPLGPGLLTFRADQIAGKSLPPPAQAVAANYAHWPTVGTLLLTVRDPQVLERLKAITGLPVAPSHLWYSKVEITENFLFQSLAALRQPKVIGGKTVTLLPLPPNSDWVKNAVAGFLKGHYEAELVAGAQQSGDTLATVEMPRFAPPQSDTFDLYLMAAFDGQPFDGEYKDFAVPAGVSTLDAAHPRYGAIPARLLYRSLRTHASGNMIDATAGNAVPDAVLAASGTQNVPDYYPVRFTRVWKPIEDRSVHFPSQVVQATQLGAGSLVINQRLPSHGIFFLAITPLQRLGSAAFSLMLPYAALPEREMFWLLGDTPEAWRGAASDSPVSIILPPANQAMQSIPHVILRRRMGQEIIYDRKERPRGFGGSCTFFSLRRTVRALVNNRIAGGRLNFEVYYSGNRVTGKNSSPKNSQETRALLKEALGTDADGLLAARSVLDGQPNHRAGEGLAGTAQDAAIGAAALTLIPVLKKMFPDPVPLQSIGGATVPEPGYSYGRAAFSVWESALGEFEKNGTKRAFAAEWLGGGGPGAIVALALAADYAVNPGQTTVRTPPTENDISFRSRNVEDLLAANLQAGAPLQFWTRFSDLQKIRSRTNGFKPIGEPNDIAGVGHSPIFLEYSGPSGNPSAMYVLDQGGVPTQCLRTGGSGSFTLPWGGYTPDCWISAEWLE